MTTVVGPILEETVVRTGLEAVHRVIGDSGLLEFPTRPNGTPLLLRQSFFEKLFGATVPLSSFPSGDIAAAKADVKNLSLTQLLHIRCKYLDAGAGKGTAQAEFVEAVSAMLAPKLVESWEAASDGAVSVDPDNVQEVVRSIMLLYGAYEELKDVTSQHWLLRATGIEAILHLPTCELHAVESLQVPTLVHNNLSRSTASVPLSRRKLHWEVQTCEDPANFEEKVAPAGVATERRGAYKPGARRAMVSAATAAAGADPSALQKVMVQLEAVQETEREQRKEIGELRDQLDAAKAEIEELKESLAETGDMRLKKAEAKLQLFKNKAEAEKEALKADLEKSKQVLAEAEAKLASAASGGGDEAAEELKALQRELDSTKETEAETELRLQAAQEALATERAAAEKSREEATEEAAALQEALNISRQTEAETERKAWLLQEDLEKARVDIEALKCQGSAAAPPPPAAEPPSPAAAAPPGPTKELAEDEVLATCGTTLEGGASDAQADDEQRVVQDVEKANEELALDAAADAWSAELDREKAQEKTEKLEEPAGDEPAGEEHTPKKEDSKDDSQDEIMAALSMSPSLWRG